MSPGTAELALLVCLWMVVFTIPTALPRLSRPSIEREVGKAEGSLEVVVIVVVVEGKR